MKIKISPSILISGAFFALGGRIYLFICYLCALALHELAHAARANGLGYALRSLDLGAMGAKLSLDEEVVKPSDEIKIALAGPLINLAVCVFLAGVWWLFPDTYFFTADFFKANAALFAFNLLPAYPLDGGRVLFALTRKRKHAKFFRITASVVSALALGALFVFRLGYCVDVTALLAVWFVITGAVKNKDADVFCKIYDSAFRDEKFKSVLPIRLFAISEKSKVSVVRKKLRGEYYGVMRVMESGVFLTERDFVAASEISGKSPVCELKSYKKRKTNEKNGFFG
ncbi:MAG: site-2 protease family protein [Candidatus Neoclostridium sp.]